MKPPPPKYALRFLRWFCREDSIDEIEGDLLELFQLRSLDSVQTARRRFLGDTIRSFRLTNFKRISKNNLSMITLKRWEHS